MKESNYLYDLKLLYVEDDALIQSKMAKLLKKYFKSLTVCSNGEDGLNSFKNEKFDLIISDINMPKLSGLQMLQSIRELGSDIPVIFTTARTESSSIIKAIELKVNDYILKPIDFAVLIEKIEKISFEIEAIENKRLLEQYKTVVDENCVVIKYDLNKNISYVNDMFLNLSSYKKKDLIGKPFNQLLDESIENLAYEKMWDSLEANNVFMGKLKKKTFNNELLVLDATVLALKDFQNKTFEYMLVANDITQMELNKEALESKIVENEKSITNKAYLLNEYRKSIDESSLIIRLNKNFEVSFVNNSLLELSCKNAKELNGELFWNLLEDKENLSELKKGVLENKHFSMLLTLFKRKKINFTFSKILDEEENLIEYLLIGNDITKIIELYKEIEKTQADVLFSLGTVGELRSNDTANHVKRVSEFSYLLAKLSGLNSDKCKLIKEVAPMHDIGKIGIPDNILLKPGKLDDEEFEIMKTHSALGYDMFKNSERKLLKAAAIVSHEHHERWDGKGYPRGIKGNDISIMARVVSVADVFDALISKREYKEAWELHEIKSYFIEEKGKQFDPDLAQVFVENIESFENIYKQYSQH